MISRNNAFILLPVLLLGFPLVSRADSFPGVASAYQLIALGYGNNLGAISLSFDTGGRIAASHMVHSAPGVGKPLNGGPFAALADGPQASMGASPIDFDSLGTPLDAEGLYLGSLLTAGEVLTAGQPGFPSGANSSWVVLRGSSDFVDIFNISAAQFASANHPLDIEVPSGATVILNVAGTPDSLGGGITINGVQPSQTGAAAADVLVHFPGAASASLDGEFTASLLASLASMTGNPPVHGTIIVHAIADNGEVHNAQFPGDLSSPPTAVTPEPGSLLLLGSGTMGIACLVLWKRSIGRFVC
jgi:choice-of-anchor A domain-containing protein